jgi:hypothetical protein
MHNILRCTVFYFLIAKCTVFKYLLKSLNEDLYLVLYYYSHANNLIYVFKGTVSRDGYLF